MAHPDRFEYVSELLKVLPEAKVVWDEREDRWDTRRRSLLAFDRHASHLVVLQDDAIPSTGLLDEVERLVQVVPDNPISLYTGKVRPFEHEIKRAVNEARKQGLSWMVLDNLLWGVGIVLPVPLIRKLVAYHDIANIRIKADDSKMQFYFNQKKIQTYYTLPSLVDHRDGPSLIPGNRPQGRTAHWFEDNPLDVDWETDAVTYNSSGSLVTVPV